MAQAENELVATFILKANPISKIKVSTATRDYMTRFKVVRRMFVVFLHGSLALSCQLPPKSWISALLFVFSLKQAPGPYREKWQLEGQKDKRKDRMGEVMAMFYFDIVTM